MGFKVKADGSVSYDMYALARAYGRTGLQRLANDMAAAGVTQKVGMTVIKTVAAVAR